MQKVRFGKTELEITPVGFGAWAIGGSGWRAAWGPQDDGEAVGAIQRAVELGVNWVDTAAVYGLGHSEELAAQALKGFSDADRPYVFTKCSLVWDEGGDISNILKRDRRWWSPKGGPPPGAKDWGPPRMARKVIGRSSSRMRLAW